MAITATNPFGFRSSVGFSENCNVLHSVIHKKAEVKQKSLIAAWLEQAPQWHEVYCHNLEVMSSNPGWVELSVRSAYVLSHTWTKRKY